MLAVLAAVLALAGAPANTHVVCNPAVNGGLTHYRQTPALVELGTTPCAGWLLAAASAPERTRIGELNPGVDLDRLLGVGLVAMLHEAFHAALVSGDETLVQCAAMRDAPALFQRLGLDSARLMPYVVAWDSTLPAAYHSGAC